MLPQLNGLDVCRRIRNENKKTPILFLTAVGTPESIVQGLGAEADDYLVKPFKFIELLARIKSLLRRAELPRQDTPPQSEGSVIRFADLWVNDYSKTVKRGNQIITLTSTEYRLLLLFMKNPERVFSRVEILDHVWGVDFNMGTNVVDVYINYLRKKIDKNHSQKLLHTVIGMGYVLKQKDEDPD